MRISNRFSKQAGDQPRTPELEPLKNAQTVYHTLVDEAYAQFSDIAHPKLLNARNISAEDIKYQHGVAEGVRTVLAWLRARSEEDMKGR